MALATLRCQRDAQDHKDTRQRMTIFSGEPFAFDKYHIRLRVEQEMYLLSPAANVIDSLRAMCWRVLMETCDTKLMVRGESSFLSTVRRSSRAAEKTRHTNLWTVHAGNRWWSMLRSMGHTLELGNSELGGKMGEAGLSRCEYNMDRGLNPNHQHCSNNIMTFLTLLKNRLQIPPVLQP